MEKKTIVIILFEIILIVIITIGVAMYLVNNGIYKNGKINNTEIINVINTPIEETDKTESQEIPDNYIAVFHGETGEEEYATYIYKIDNEHYNYGFEYINAVITTSLLNESDKKIKIIDKGQFDWTDNAFSIAKKNNAYSYVTTTKESKEKYTIEEFQNRFIMN